MPDPDCWLSLCRHCWQRRGGGEGKGKSFERRREEGWRQFSPDKSKIICAGREKEGEKGEGKEKEKRRGGLPANVSFYYPTRRRHEKGEGGGVKGKSVLAHPNTYRLRR